MDDSKPPPSYTPTTPHPNPYNNFDPATSPYTVPQHDKRTDGLPSGTLHETAGDSGAHDRHSDRYGFPAHPPQPPDNKAIGSDLLLYALAIFIPPVPVFLKAGCGFSLIVNIILWSLGWIPGVIHSFYVITTHLSFE
ncbi:uncharacterized protein EHS24_002178 [Apiotrichum porosum]|uniref:Plasma membrane proteolipid Pmp3 n=1 Tax=Apiotrichum porosum TaxID=105984 RepID=A0A427XI54_9TREE|nr:uncharacterized protein EHS24_002178 [Apiotrichum porosum]RSH78453.1 hypothetical protein EHS24_002178 [Apiotrichum porosum]